MPTASRKIQPGYLYARKLEVAPGQAIPGLENLNGLIKLGKAKNLAEREPGYEKWNQKYYPMVYGPVFAAVQVDDYDLAELLLLAHFKQANVVSEFGTAARKQLSPELAKIAEVVGNGRECFRISPEAAKEVLLQLGEPVSSPPLTWVIADGEEDTFLDANGQLLSGCDLPPDA